MNRQPTPETDAAEIDMSSNGITIRTKFVAANIARDLERKRDNWKAIALELACYVKGGYEDEDAAISRFTALRDNAPSPWMPKLTL